MSTEIFVHSIGTVAIDLPDRRVGPSAGQPFALLLYLASQRGRPAPRRFVQDLLFAGALHQRSTHSLRQLLYRVRNLGWPIEADDDQIALTVDRLSIDWEVFLNAPTIAREDLERLGGGLFPGYAPSFSDAFREWFDGERTAIVRRLSTSLTTQLAQLRRAGRWDLVELTARALLALDPLSEEGTLATAEALAVSGSKRAALGVIDGYLQEVGDQQPLRVVPSAVKRRISERLPDETQRAIDERLFVGREEQMRVLSALGTSTRAGNQQVLLLWGEPGVGKTRLIAEYRALAALQGALTISVACRPHDVFRPLGILGDLVTQLFDAPGALGCDPGARVLLQRLVNVNRAIDGTREATVAEVSISAVVRSLSDLISAVAVEVPLQAFVDDAQWMDENSRTAILGAFAGGTSRRSSLVLSSRERTILAGTERYTDSVLSARLSPLDHGAARALTYGLLKGSRPEEIDDIARRVLEQARGNPFVIRTLCAHYLDTNDAESLKHTLTEVLARRLERLPSEARHALESAVILAKNCTLERLERLLEVSRQQLLLAIEELDAQGLIEVTDGYTVRSHDLLGDAVRERMAPAVCRLLHGAAAQLLHNEAAGGASDALLWDCAEHWRQSGNDDRAMTLLLECADRSAKAGRATDAVVTLRHALTLNSTDEKRLSVVEKGLNVAWISNVYVEARSFLSELMRLREALGQPVHVHDSFELLELAVTKHDGIGDVGTLLERLRACISAPSAPPSHRLAAGYWMTILADTMLDREAADFGYRVVIEESRRTPESEMIGARQTTPMIYEAGFGDTEKARTIARGIIASVRPDLARYVPLLFNTSMAQYRVGPPAEAEETMRVVLGAARKYSFAGAETNITLSLARLYWSTERLDECRECHRQVTELLPYGSDNEVVVDYCILGARLATIDGRFDDAAAYISRARTIPYARLPLPDLLLRCCELDVRLTMTADAVADGDLEELLALHRRARGMGLQDEVMSTVLKCLDRNGRSDEGTRLLDEYLRNHRRDGFPVPSWLGQRLARRPADGVDALSVAGAVADAAGGIASPRSAAARLA